MFLHRLAAGLVFATGAGLSRLGVTGESFLLIGLGLGAALGGLTWFASSGPSVRPRRSVSTRQTPVAEAVPTR